MQARRIILHHSATATTATVADIDRMHRQRGFSSIGYHLLLRQPDSRQDLWTIEVGRPLTVQGAHDRGQNADSWGVCLAGDYSRQRPSPGALAALRCALLQLCLVAGRLLPVEGHRDNEPPSTPTVCPGQIPVAELAEDLAVAWARRLAA